MKLRKRYKSSKANILLPLIFLFVVFLSVGYSSLNQELNITSEAVFRVEESIRITDVKLVGSTFNGIENYNSSYSKDRIKTGITLNESNSSITYQVTITNTGNVPMNLSFLDNINYNNDGITYELNEKLPYMINKGEEKKIELTYKWSSYNEESKNLDSVIRFNFIKAESVLAKGSSSSFVNNSSFDRSKVESIKFMPTIEVPSSAIEAWDASLNKDGSVMAYTLDNDSNDLYELYIAGYGEIKLSEAYHLFIDFSNVITLESLSLLDTSDVTTMSNMFRNCSKLAGEIDLSHFNMQNVTSVEQMFMNDGKITTLKLNNWDAPKLTKVYEIFQWCKMASIEMNNFNAPKLSDVSDMFGNGRLANIKSISINNWNIPSVTNLYRMFYGKSNLTELNIEGFNAPSATNVANMFYGCSSLAGTLDLSNFDTSNVTDMSNMFNGCSSVTNLDLSKFKTGKVKDMNKMFQYCSSLTNLDVSNFDTSEVTNMNCMFFYCSKLVNIDVSNFDTSNVTLLSSMFEFCNSLENLSFNNINLASATDISNMIKNCPSLKTLDISGVNSSIYEKDIFKNMINQVGDITFYVKDSECKTLLEAIKPNATIEIQSV